MTIGEKVKARRNELSLTQRDLAKKMGYSNHTVITKIEAGQVDLPLSRAKQLAEALDTDVFYLMGWEHEEDPEELAEFTAKLLANSKAKKATQLFFELNDSEQDLVMDLMQKLKKEN